MNRANLEKLINFIPTIPDEQFHMGILRVGNESTHICNSIGCILGHATALDTPDHLDQFRYKGFTKFNGDIKFVEWSGNFFGINGIEKEWDFLFASSWHRIDNTKEGAIARIQWLLDRKEVTSMYQTRDRIEKEGLFYLPTQATNNDQ